MDFLSGNTLPIICGILIAIVIGVFIFAKVKDKKGGKKAVVKKNSKKKKNGAATGIVKDSVPYLHTYEDGIIETKSGTFTKAYQIADINFKIAPEDEQAATFIKFGKLLNSFTPDVKFQILIENKNEDKASSMNHIIFTPQPDDLNPFRREMNEVLIEKMKEGRNNITQAKILVVSLEAQNIIQAKKKFTEIDNIIDRKFRDISKDHPARPMNLVERLHDLYDIYNPTRPNGFYNAKDKDGTPIFDIAHLLKSGMTTKDAVGPESMDFSATSHFMLGDTYGRTLYLHDIPNWLTTEFLADIADIMCNMLISINYEPIDKQKAVKAVHNIMLDIDGQIADRQKKASQDGYSADLVSPSLIKQQEYARNLIDDITARDQNMFFVTMAITVFADSMEGLDSYTNSVMDAATGHMCSIKKLSFQQELGLQECLPLCLNSLEQRVSKMFTTESSAIFIPYTTQELHQKEGLYYGLNETSKNMIIYNRLFGENYNGLIFGEPGNGKSFAAKMEMISVALRHKDSVIYIIDPEAEYVDLARSLGGEIIDLAPGSINHLNPLDMDIDYGGDTDPIGMKTEFILSMMEIMLGTGRTLNAEEKSVITRCVQSVYRPYLEMLDNAIQAGENITSDPSVTPTLARLCSEIKMQDSPVASGLAAVLDPYANGSLATFSNRSNVNTSAKIVVYNIKNLGTGTKNLGLHICINDIWNKMIENSKKGIYTWFYIDEFYLLLQSPSSAQFLASIWKRARKYNGVPTGILQNTEDLLRTPDTRAILNNSSFVQMLSLKKADRANLAEMLSLSESQLTHITDAGPGRGLIYAGKTILPFVNHFPKDTNLYQLMSTSSTKDEKLRTIFRQ